MLDPIVVENLLHLAERALAEHMFKIRMPDPEARETRSRSRFHAFPEIERTIFFVAVRKSARNGPVRSEQIKVALHSRSLKRLRLRLPAPVSPRQQSCLHWGRRSLPVVRYREWECREPLPS